MDAEEYRKRGRECVDYIADYLENIRTQRVFPDVKPGYMRPLLADSAPLEGETWESIFRDFENVIMPGVTHWQSPYMHAYFPALTSYPSMLADMLADAINQIGFTWASSPACTELETIVMDWLAKMIGLPNDFLHSNKDTMGGGVIMTTASEATYTCLLAARSEVIRRVQEMDDDLSPSIINDRLVGYCSDQAHSGVEKCGIIGLVKMRLLPSDNKLSLRGETLRQAIERDREEGLIPFFVCATLGTTGSCSFDALNAIGPICAEENIWLHIDAAYAGTAFVCPEFRIYLEGIEGASSFAFNPSKWMMVHFDCTAMWVKDSRALHRTFNVDPLYLKHENSGAAVDFMHWQIGLSRRFRSLKLWAVIRSFGITGLQKHVREGVRLAKLFEDLIKGDDRFELPTETVLSMVCFRLKGENELTEDLLKKLNKSGKLHMVPASLKGQYVIRFTVTSHYTKTDDILRDWAIIRDVASYVLNDEEEVEYPEPTEKMKNEISNMQKGIIKRNPKINQLRHKEFGLSLILSNVPQSPIVINGSFAALFDNNDVTTREVISQFAKHLSERDLHKQALVLSPRRKLKYQNKQYSLDISSLALAPKDTFLEVNGTRRIRQSSLDSKIEDIFDEYNESSDSQSNSLSPELTNGNPKMLTRHLSEGGHIVCQHCGHMVKF